MKSIFGEQALPRQILVVEDEDSIRESLRALLELEGYRVFEAANGEQALMEFRRMGRPALILLDLYLPIMTGPEFIAALVKEDPGILKRVPLLVLTASPLDGDAALSVVPFIRKCIQKPFNSDDLLEQIKDLVQVHT
ncbi:MAG TPA: hypothetical protein DCS07_04335 [Bdellovibrionales bacterium]|nr:MAG: hypothetical protein A2Z97_06950 [Bdellovibrionales bacterium GWB1_52_6]OFZ05456.1 MAG: hypothetical protein A2X97_11300 [Bdellovibrionales bacterium GWA1_52_35]OFZ36289.1 MAG: hypothetical protein A2070_12490 [Bdellovibrionales bacterium GWC1_52_8]HAR41847.1 hypothetical protein [Bdellovibrionales bacterium]HCM39181.1 hypothetical protein [Bdellovibrionales bacterium]